MVIEACPQCGAPFEFHGGESTTLVGSYSPIGHNHDDNCLKRAYVCENHHATVLSLRRTCPGCEWKGKETCFCHEGPKVDAWPTGARPPRNRDEALAEFIAPRNPAVP